MQRRLRADRVHSAAAQAVAAEDSGTVYVACVVEQNRSGKCPVRTATEAVQHGFRAGRIQLEKCSVTGIAGASSRAIAVVP